MKPKAQVEYRAITELKELVANYRATIPTTIIREPKPSKSEEHPTMKPVRLIAKLIGNSSREREREFSTSLAGAARL